MRLSSARPPAGKSFRESVRRSPLSLQYAVTNAQSKRLSGSYAPHIFRPSASDEHSCVPVRPSSARRVMLPPASSSFLSRYQDSNAAFALLKSISGSRNCSSPASFFPLRRGRRGFWGRGSRRRNFSGSDPASHFRRKSGRFNYSSGMQDAQAFHQMSQLPHIPRPWPAFQGLYCHSRKHGRRQTASVHACGKGRQQQGNIFRSFAQRRKTQRKHLQSIIEICPEFPAGDGFLKIFVGRGNDAHIDLERLHSTDALKLCS